MKCKNCARFVHVNEDNERTTGKPNWCFYLEDSPCEDLERECKAFTPLRNADRIRSMTDEELAEWLDNEFGKCEWCDVDSLLEGECEARDDCKLCILDWMRQEVE